MIVAGDPSGDIHGAYLAEALRARRPDIRLFGMGGSRMQAAGVRLLFNLSAFSTVGFVEALRNLPILKRLLTRVSQVLDHQQPDVLVLIDFPGFNMKLAEIAHGKGIPVVYYFCPTAWAWGKGRAQEVARHTARVLTVLPVEDEVYREAGANVTYVGHPAVDMVKRTQPPGSIRARLGVGPEQPLIALLPGSRQQEVRQLLPLMIRAAARIAQEISEARFAVAVAHTLQAEELERSVLTDPDDRKQPWWPAWLEGCTHDVVADSDIAVVACGTATLETALLGTPMVAVYKLNQSTYVVTKMLVKIPFAALPNIIAGKQVVPELLQGDATDARIASEVVALWKNPAAREAMRAEYEAIRQRLGGPGAVQRAAEAVLEVGEAR